MKKCFFLVVGILVCLWVGFVFVVWYARISPIFLEREWRERFVRSTYQINPIIVTIPNDRSYDHTMLPWEDGPVGKRFNLPFDTRRDILFVAKDQSWYGGYGAVTGNWAEFVLPHDEHYSVAISVCKEWFAQCTTQYFENPQCLELIYVPDFYERERFHPLTGCAQVDISHSNDWSNLLFRVKY